MTDPAGPTLAELSSIGTALGDLSRRVTGMAEASAGGADDWLATELFGVERSVVDANRRLDALTARIRARR